MSAATHAPRPRAARAEPGPARPPEAPAGEAGEHALALALHTGRAPAAATAPAAPPPPSPKTLRRKAAGLGEDGRPVGEGAEAAAAGAASPSLGLALFVRGPGGSVAPAFRERRTADAPVAALGGSGGAAPRADAPAATRDGVAVFRPGTLAGPRGREVEAHEAVHAAQFAAGRAGAATGTRPQLEADAARGSRALLAGRPYAPRVGAPAGAVLAFEDPPFLPNPVAEGERNAASLSTLGPGAEQSGNVEITAGEEKGAAGEHAVAYRIRAQGSGPRGSVDTTTELTVRYDPGDPTGTGVGPGVVMIDPELSAGPQVPVDLYPVTVHYRRTLVLHDADGRDVTVHISGSVAFTHQTWAEQMRGREPTFETLLQLQGDKAGMSVDISGTGPIQPYLAYYDNPGSSLGIQSSLAEAELPLGAGVFPFTADVPARFIRPDLTAGAQFDALEAFLVSADALELLRRMQQAPPEEVGWLEEILNEVGGAIAGAIAAVAGLVADLWNALPEEVRGVLTAIGKFMAGIAVVLGIAAIIVFFLPEVAFATAALVVGGILMAGAFVVSAVSRTIEAVGAGIWDPNLILTVAVLDTVGLSGLIEAITDQSILSGRELNRSTEERWEAGTSGILQMIAVILGARSIFGGKGGTRGPGGNKGPLDGKPGTVDPTVDPLVKPPVETVPRDGEVLPEVKPVEPPVRAGKYDAARRTDAELILDRDPTPRPGETAAEAADRANAAQAEIAIRGMLSVYEALGEEPKRFRMVDNDATYEPNGAHTLERHGPQIPLRRTDPGAAAGSLEGRIYGDAPWPGQTNYSYKWFDTATMDAVINKHIRLNWEQVRSDLAMNGRYEAVFDAHNAVGEGFYNEGMFGFGPRNAVYHVTSWVTLTLELIPGMPPRWFVVRAFPTGGGPRPP